ncbi:MAG: hypothetical protein OIF50_12555 [Flavobacteriaceae bacterium]|nr:hypothetical protein [Flavobacteriaceae bacterium]
MKNLLYFLVVVFLLSCADSAKKDTKKKAQKSTVYEMYEPSEMATLMNDFYAYNEKLKANIEAGKPLDEEGAKLFENIHTAVLTDSRDKDALFDAWAIALEQAQKGIFNNSVPGSQKEKFNAAVRVCVSCHEKKCSGPISRIEKLYIRT